MDAKLLAWGRAAAARQHRQTSAVPRHPTSRDVACHGARRAACIPPLWLFTDSRRLADPRAAIARLPRGLAGVVFRHDDAANRSALGRDIARICRAHRLTLVVAGDIRLAVTLRAGVHLRGGRWPGPIRTHGVVTSSAHSLSDLHRAARAGARLAFLSPVYATASHPGEPSLGPVRWSGLARAASIAVAALGGIDGSLIRRLPARLCRGVGAIGALS